MGDTMKIREDVFTMTLQAFQDAGAICIYLNSIIRKSGWSRLDLIYALIDGRVEDAAMVDFLMNIFDTQTLAAAELLRLCSELRVYAKEGVA